jgi:nitric oxide reductase NorQ protein
MTSSTEAHPEHRTYAVEEYAATEEPYYESIGDEEDLFRAAFEQKIPVLLKGPTGCGKTRFVEHMAYQLGRPLAVIRKGENGNEDLSPSGLPVVTVACHEDLTASDLVGRYLLEGDTTRWMDGPLTRAVKAGAICYLDEVVEARKDTIVLIHPLTDDRRILPVEKRGTILQAPDEFLLVVSYNPGYQSVLKDLKQSTRQRFVALEFDYPPAQLEAAILMHEGKVDEQTARDLVVIGEKVRNLKGHGLEEGVSTRLLVYAAQLVSSGIHPHTACEVAITNPITDDRELQRSIREIVTTVI